MSQLPVTSSEPLERPLRADARRNRERIVAAARQIVAERGSEAQIDEVARKAGVGVGTVYRHFPTKDALMGELLGLCALENAEVAIRAAAIEDPWEAFATMVLTICEEMEHDAARRRAWSAASPDAFAYAAEAKQKLTQAGKAIIDRAHAGGVLREDFAVEDMGPLMCGLSAAIEMESRGGVAGWRRLAGYALDGLRTR